MQTIWSVVDLLCQNPHWWSPIISSAYGVNLDCRMWDKILYVVGKSDTPLWLRQSVLSPFLQTGRCIIDSFHTSGNSSLFQIELVNLWISMQIVLLSTLIISAGICLLLCDLCVFSFSVAGRIHSLNFFSDRRNQECFNYKSCYLHQICTLCHVDSFVQWSTWSTPVGSMWRRDGGPAFGLDTDNVLSTFAVTGRRLRVDLTFLRSFIE